MQTRFQRACQKAATIEHARSCVDKQKQTTGIILLKNTGSFAAFGSGIRGRPILCWETSSQEGITATTFTKHDVGFAHKYRASFL